MKHIRSICCIAFLSILYGCPDKVDKKADELHHSYETVVDTMFGRGEAENSIQLSMLEYLTSYGEIYEAKRLSEGVSTSTYLSKEQSAQYMRPKENGFFGSYSIFLDTNNYANLAESIYEDLPNDTAQLVSTKTCDNFIHAELVVFNDENPWYYNNTTDIFIEMNTHSSGLPIFGIEVGDSKEKLSNQFGSPDWKYKNVWIYKIAGKTNSLAFFCIRHNGVAWMQFGFYNPAIIENPLNYVTTLLSL